jgi:hypothetical protein
MSIATERELNPHFFGGAAARPSRNFTRIAAAAAEKIEFKGDRFLQLCQS